jgi:hypothetical protein
LQAEQTNSYWGMTPRTREALRSKILVLSSVLVNRPGCWQPAVQPAEERNPSRPLHMRCADRQHQVDLAQPTCRCMGLINRWVCAESGSSPYDPTPRGAVVPAAHHPTRPQHCGAIQSSRNGLGGTVPSITGVLVARITPSSITPPGSAHPATPWEAVPTAANFSAPDGLVTAPKNNATAATRRSSNPALTAQSVHQPAPP